MPSRPKTHRARRPPAKDARPSASARGYDTAWRKLRLVVLAARPVCEACGRESAAHVDHHLSLEMGGTNDLSNLRAYCAPCHARKTVLCDRGFGRAPVERRQS